MKSLVKSFAYQSDPQVSVAPVPQKRRFRLPFFGAKTASVQSRVDTTHSMHIQAAHGVVAPRDTDTGTDTRDKQEAGSSRTPSLSSIVSLPSVSVSSASSLSAASSSGKLSTATERSVLLPEISSFSSSVSSHARSTTTFPSAPSPTATSRLESALPGVVSAFSPVSVASTSTSSTTSTTATTARKQTFVRGSFRTSPPQQQRTPTTKHAVAVAHTRPALSPLQPLQTSPTITQTTHITRTPLPYVQKRSGLVPALKPEHVLFPGAVQLHYTDDETEIDSDGEKQTGTASDAREDKGTRALIETQASLAALSIDVGLGRKIVRVAETDTETDTETETQPDESPLQWSPLTAMSMKLHQHPGHATWASAQLQQQQQLHMQKLQQQCQERLRQRRERYQQQQQAAQSERTDRASSLPSAEPRPVSGEELWAV